MKTKFTLCAFMLAMAAQTAHARTEVMSYPLKPVLDGQQPDVPVKLYFGAQEHPAVTKRQGDVTKSVRIARKMDGEQASCNEALSEALQALRQYAHDRAANGVINIRSSFHSTTTASDSQFSCGVSGSAAALVLRGDVVTLEAK